MKKILAALLSAVFVSSMIGCSPADSSNPSDTNAAAQGTAQADDYSDLTVGIILKTLSSEYWGYVEAGIRDAESDLGCTVELTAPPSETSYDEQMSIIETMKARPDISAIAVAPLQPDMAATLLRDASVPVLAVDTRIEGADNTLCFVGTDHESAAYDGAKELCEDIGEGCRVALIQGVQGDTTNTARFKGFQEGAEAAGAEVVEVQYCNAAEDQARNCMDSILIEISKSGRFRHCVCL